MGCSSLTASVETSLVIHKKSTESLIIKQVAVQYVEAPLTPLNFIPYQTFHLQSRV